MLKLTKEEFLTKPYKMPVYVECEQAPFWFNYYPKL